MAEPCADRTRTFLRLRRGAERGASLVEYTLLVAALAVPTIGGLDLLRSEAGDTADGTAEEISTKTIPPAPPTSSTPPASTTTTTTTTTTTIPVTTTAAPTTTVAPTTTTTTRPRASRSVSSWASTSADVSSNAKKWTAAATTTIRDEYGAAVANAQVTIRIEYRYGTGPWRTYVAGTSATTGASGSVEVTTGSFGTPKDPTSPAATEIRFTVTAVSKPGLTWQGGSPVVVSLPV